LLFVVCCLLFAVVVVEDATSGGCFVVGALGRCCGVFLVISYAIGLMMEDGPIGQIALRGILKRMRNETNECEKLVALSCIVDNVDGLFFGAQAEERYCEQALEVVVGEFSRQLGMKVSRSTGLTNWFKGQLLVTLTTVFIVLDVYQHDHRCFLDLVVVLLTYIFKPNKRSDQSLRQNACECLRELELMYPGLLEDLVGDVLGTEPHSFQAPISLFQCVQLENAFIRHSYANLLVTVLLHAVEIQAEGLKPVFASHQGGAGLRFHVSQESVVLKDPPGTYEITNRFYPTCLLLPECSNGLNKKRGMIEGKMYEVLSMILGMLPEVSNWSRAHFIGKIVALSRYYKLPANTFSHHIHRYLFSSDPLLILLCVLIHIHTENSFERIEDGHVLQQVLGIVGSTSFPSPFRVLACQWALKLSRDDLLSQHFLLLPGRADPLQIRTHRITALIRCCSGVNRDCTEEGKMVLLDMIKRTISEERFSCDVLPLPSDSLAMTATLNSIGEIINGFPEMWSNAAEFLASIAIEHIHVLDSIILFLDSLMTGDRVDEAIQILGRVGFVVARVENPNALTRYFKLFNRIARESRICPLETVAFALLRLVRASQAWVERLTWDMGSSILECCELIIKVHPLGLLRDRETHFVKLLTCLCTSSWLDMYVQDRAYELQQLTKSNVSRLDIAYIFSSKRFTKDERDSLFPCLTPIMQPSPDLKTFLILTRGATLLRDFAGDANSGDLSLVEYTKLVEHGTTADIRIPVSIYLEKPIAFALKEASEIFGLVLEFEPVDAFKTIQPLEVAYIKVNKKQESDIHRATLSIYPLRPLPSKVRVRARFSVHDGSMLEGPIGEVSIHTRDLFLPLPVPPDSRSRLFPKLWDKFHHFCSVRCLSLSQERVKKWISEDISPFLVSKISGNNMQQEELLQDFLVAPPSPKLVENAAVLLPPSHHLLFQFRLSSESTLVRIRTDTWEILALIDAFFDRWS